MSCSYNKAHEIKVAQDEYCASALAGEWEGLAPEFPEDYQWEALVDVLRGRVKVSNSRWFLEDNINVYVRFILIATRLWT